MGTRSFCLLERVEDDTTDVAFRLDFPKARGRALWNRADFDSVVIKLVDGQKQLNRATKRIRLTSKQQAAFDLLPSDGSMSISEWRNLCEASPSCYNRRNR